MSKRRREPSDYEGVQSSSDEFYMNHNYIDDYDDYTDKSDNGSDIIVPRNRDCFEIPKKSIDLYKISNTKLISNMHTA